VASDPSEHPAVDPDAILRQPFSTVRKGYDPLEVQKYLMALATELRAGRERERLLERQLVDATKRAAQLEHLSPQRLTSMLGEETAKVIEAANTASSDIRTKAEENVARLLRDAQEQSNRMRQEAEAVLERKTAEAEEAAARIRSQAEEVLQQARIDADADAEQGRERGREMVTEAQRVRERMLRDLVRRRKTLRQQIEQLNAGRERLIEAYAVVRQALDAATNELDIVLPEAKIAADKALQRAVESDGATLDEDMAMLSAELREPVVRVGEPASATVPASSPSPSVESAPADSVDVVATPDVIDDDIELIEEGGLDDYHEPRAPDPVAGRHSSAVNVIVPSLADEDPETDPIDSPDDPDDAESPDPATAIQPPRDLENPMALDDPMAVDDTDGLASSAARVANLFARIKDEAAADEVHGEAAARLIPTEAPPEGDDQVGPDADELPLADRYALVVRELERSLARHVKRELSDEQNEMLDAVRRDPEAPATQLLAEPEDHVERYVNAASATLSDAALAASELVPEAARQGPDGPRVGGLARDVAAELAAELVAPLRVRVEASFAEASTAGEEAVDLGETVRADYREWRTQRVDPLVTRAVVTAMNRGVLAAVNPGTAVRWLVVGSDPACGLCRGNEEADLVPAGDLFPSGHTAPPIHDGCRCVLVVDSA
jgi:cell division septum initiation protein DivIVA